MPECHRQQAGLNTFPIQFLTSCLCCDTPLSIKKMNEIVALLHGWDDAIVEFWKMTKSYLESYNSLAKRLNSLIIPSGISIVNLTENVFQNVSSSFVFKLSYQNSGRKSKIVASILSLAPLQLF
jgi:hypothetical protein